MSYRLFDLRYPFEFIASREARGRRAANLIWGKMTKNKGSKMPEKSTMQKAKEDLREGKSPSTAAGEFVHEEIERPARANTALAQQAIAISLSKARRAGIRASGSREEAGINRSGGTK
jgi:hypothetical protein